MIGETISHYRIAGKLGQGGMGEVYRATDTRLNRDVAIKLLPEHFANDGQRMGRFQREAQVLASLNHPNIASIYGVEEENGRKALIMELAEGEDLSERIARGPVPLDEAVPIALQLAEALEDAHEKGIIHRDLKPANIKLTPEGKVKILDFGLAKALEDPVSGAQSGYGLSQSPTLSMAATQAGMILGTAAYMSPEQARGKAVDKRTDIWAFGVVLFEMLTGGQLFQGEDVSLTLAAVMTGEPHWEKLPRGIPARIRNLLERCLEKDSRERLQAIGEVRIALQRYLDNPAEEEAVSTQPSAAMFGRWHNLVWSGLLLVGVIIAGFSGWLLKPEPPTPTPQRLDAHVTVGQPLYTSWGNSTALSSDGKQLAFVTGPGGTRGAAMIWRGADRRLHLRSLDRLESEMLPGTEEAYAPFFSPDGRWIGFFTVNNRGGALKKISVSGGAPLTLCPAGLARGATWGTDGTIVFSQQSGLMAVSAAGGAPRELTQREEAEEAGHYWPQFLPGGRLVLFVSYQLGSSQIEVVDSQIEVVDLQTSQRKIIHQGGRYPRYAASGHLLYVDGGTLFAAPFDLQQLELDAEPLPVLHGVLTDSGPRGAAQYAVSSDGTLVYLRGSFSGERKLVWVDESGTVAPASETRRPYGGFHRLSPDGKRVAVMIPSNEGADIWVVDLERDLQTRVTFDQASDANPVWSADGRSLYFGSNWEGKLGIYRKSADGLGEAEQLWEGDSRVVRDVSRDGKYLAYCPVGEETGTDVSVLPLEDGSSPEPFLATPAEEGSPRFSPDGRWMAYDSDETGRYEVYVRRFPGPGGKFQVSGEGGFRPQWSENGRRLFYRTEDAIWVNSVDVKGDVLEIGRARRLVDLHGSYDQSLAVAPDGRRFLLISNEQEDGGELSGVTFVFHWYEELQRLAPTE